MKRNNKIVNKLEEDFAQITRKASISFKIENNSMSVNSEFLPNRFNIGKLLIWALSMFVIAISVNSADGLVRAIMLPLGILFFVFSVLSIVKQLTDFLVVTDDEIVFRNSLRKRTIQIGPDLKVKASIKRKYTRATTNGPGSFSQQVEVFIKKDKATYRIFDFSMEGNCRKEANCLRKTIKRFIKGKIKDKMADKS